jgi:hypothetical protein
VERIERNVLPTSAYNGHPRWLAYIMGAPTPVSVLGSLAAAALNQNTGLWRVTPSASAIEVQRAARGSEEQVRPGKHVPVEPEHQANNLATRNSCAEAAEAALHRPRVSFAMHTLTLANPPQGPIVTAIQTLARFWQP